MSTEKLEAIPAHQAKLIYRFNQPVNGNSEKLEMGKLALISSNKNILYSATSGLPGFQNLASATKRGKGRIPTCLQAGLTNYIVDTTPIYLPNTKGVNGNFYRILPFVVQVGSYQRSDLGIHRDTNVPGSAGCVVITLEDHWRSFEIQMKTFREQGIIQLPLLVF